MGDSGTQMVTARRQLLLVNNKHSLQSIRLTTVEQLSYLL